METGTINVGGAVVYWKVGRTAREPLERGLKSLGLEKFLPQDRTPKATLREALDELYAETPETVARRRAIAKALAQMTVADRDALAVDGAKIKRLVRGVEVPKTFNVVIETRKPGATRNGYEVMMSASVNKDGVVTTDPEKYQAEVQAKYDQMLFEIPAQTVTAILVALFTSHLGGVTLRPHGGVYWLPLSKLEQWQHIASMVEAAALKPGDTSVYLMRTAMDEAAARAVTDAIRDELTATLARLQDEIDSGELGSKALDARVKEAEGLAARLAEYEKLLGSNLVDIQQKVAAVSAAAAQASILASAVAA